MQEGTAYPNTNPVGEEHRDLAKGVMINVLGIFARSSKALYYVVITRLFGKEIFGVYLLAYSVVDLIAKFAGLGLEWGMLRRVSQLLARGREEEIRGTVFQALALAFGCSCVVALTLAFLTSFVAEILLKTPELVNPLRVLCMAIPLITLTSILLFSIRARRKMQYEVYVRSVIEPFALLIGGIMSYLIYRNAIGVILSQVLASLISFLSALFFFCKLYPPAPKNTKVKIQWRSLIAYSLPMSGMDLLNNFKSRLDLLVIARFLTPGHVGIYGAIIEIVNLIKKVRQVFEPIFMPIVSFLHETAKPHHLQKHFSLALRWIVVLAFILFLPMMMFPEIFLGVFGSEFKVGVTALLIFSIGQFFYITLGLSEDVLSMTGHPYVNLLNSAILVVMNLSLHLILIPKYGLVGAATATGGSLVFISLLRVVQTYRFIHIHPFSFSQLKPLSAAFVAFTVGTLFHFLLNQKNLVNDLLTIGIVLLIYFLILRVVLSMEPEDQEVLKRVRSRFKKMTPRKKATF